jgi:hypothetical protein
MTLRACQVSLRSYRGMEYLSGHTWQKNLAKVQAH